MDKQKYIDGFTGFAGGTNMGLAASLLPPDQTSFSRNCTYRGGYITNRPSVAKIPLAFPAQDGEEDTVLRDRFELGRFQGAAFYRPDQGNGVLIAAIGGRLFRITVGAPDVIVQEVTVSHFTPTTIVFIVPAVGAVVNVNVADASNLQAGAQVLIGGSNFLIVSVDVTTNSIVVQNIDATVGAVVAVGTVVQFYDLNPAGLPITWLQQAEKWMIAQDGQSVPIIFDGASCVRAVQVGAQPQISAGKMMAYWLGRLWWVNPDGITFRAGNAVYSSPTNDRDAVLYQTQNTFLANGGNFTVPSNAGEITAMRPVNVLDNSLGQGPLQVSTAEMIFGCTAPVDETTWITTKDTILGVSQIANGALGHYSTILCNGDMIYRSVYGIQSLILGRREFNVWGNVPISREMNPILEGDQQDLLQYGSAIVFDNRTLMTTGPVYSDRGVYHRGLISIDLDVISSMRDKAPSVYDGLWTGLKTLQILKGTFGNTERAFAFTLTESGTIELFELNNSSTNVRDNFDNTNVPIAWQFSTGSLFRKQGQAPNFKRIRLMGGEVYLDQLQGRAVIEAFFRPDESSCWVPWCTFSVCSETCEMPPDPYTCLDGALRTPQYRTRIGLGEPGLQCDPNTNKPYRTGYTFQFKFQCQGSFRFKGFKAVACDADQEEWAPMMCQDDCNQPEPPVQYSSTQQTVTCSDGGTLINNGAALGKGAYVSGNSLILPAGAFTSYVSQAAVNAEALAWLQNLFDVNLTAGKLSCAEPIELIWDNCSGTYVDAAGDTVGLSDCADMLPGVVLGSTSANFSPTGVAYQEDWCSTGLLNRYFYDLIAETGVIGPFAEDKEVTLSGVYGVQAGAVTGCELGELALNIVVAPYGGGGSTWSPNINLTYTPQPPYNDSGTWEITGHLIAGDSFQFAMQAISDVVGVGPPVTQILLQEVQIV